MGFIEQLFPTPIYVDIVKNLEEVQNEIDGVMKNLQFVEPPLNWGKTHLVSPSAHLASVSTDHLLVATLKSGIFNSFGLLLGSNIINLLFG